MRLRPLAATVARGVRDDADTIADAMLALCEAVLKYDPQYGLSVDEYVALEIHRRVRDADMRAFPPDTPNRVKYRESRPVVHRDAGGPSVQEAIAALPQPSQDVALARSSGNTWREIAASTGLSVQECRRLYHEAKVSLRQLLSTRYEK